MEEFKKQTRVQSFRVAFKGLKALFLNERNFQIHTGLAILAIAGCYFFQVSKNEWVDVILLIGLVLSVEALNTCIEYICDFISPQYNPRIKIIKDVAAAAVLMTAIIAVVIAGIIFVPHVIQLFDL